MTDHLKTIRHAINRALTSVEGAADDELKQALTALDALEQAMREPCCVNYAAGTNCFNDPRIDCPHLPPAQQAQPTECPNGDACKHGSWCTETYCQEHCQFKQAQAEAVPQDDADLALQWCGRCGEGYLNFCRVKSSECGMKPKNKMPSTATVPVVPTKEMVEAGSRDLQLGDCSGTLVRAAECYRAMLAAAPQPKEQSK